MPFYLKLSSSKASAFLLGLLSVRSHALGDSGTGLQTSISVDMVGKTYQKSSKDKSTPSTGYLSKEASKIWVREAEVTFYAPVDHLFSGTLSLAAHPEKGRALFEIHEATIATSKLLPHTNLKAGQFFLGIGRLNRTHRHDWPFVEAPKVHQEFFGSEGVLDSGAEVTVVSPVGVPLEWTFGVTNGWTFGHAHSEGKPPKSPTHYTRLALFQEMPFNGAVQIAVNALRREDSAGQKSTFLGLDAIGKWKDGKSVTFLWQAEVWQRSVQNKTTSPLRSLGFYSYQHVPLWDDVDLGVLYDGYTVLNLNDISGRKIKNFDQGISPSLNWTASEFSKFRLSYHRQFSKYDKSNTKFKQRYVQLQSTFILGSHPAHDF